MHLAQLNIAKFRYPTDDPRMAEFMDNLDRVNAVAERSAGFVWRLKDDSNNATDMRLGDDFALNLSVWQSVKHLEEFVFNTVHVQFYKRREEWVDLSKGHHLVMWWVPEGHTPSVQEAEERLNLLQDSGPGEQAFGWAEVIDTERWQARRCA
jgi:hypothetical protein